MLRGFLVGLGSVFMVTAACSADQASASGEVVAETPGPCASMIVDRVDDTKQVGFTFSNGQSIRYYTDDKYTSVNSSGDRSGLRITDPSAVYIKSTGKIHKVELTDTGDKEFLVSLSSDKISCREVT